MPDTVNQPQALSKGAVFIRRLLSSVVLWSLVLAGMFCNVEWVSDYVFLACMMLLALFGLMEFFNLVAKQDLPCFRGWGLFGGLLLMGGTFAFFQFQKLMPGRMAHGDVNDFETAFLILFVLGLCLRQFLSRNGRGISAVAITLFGLMYVPWLLNFIQKLKFYPDVDGRYYVVYFVVATKFSDIGAYCVGSLIGRHKMAPSISPGKTWEGLAGAIAFSIAGSIGFAAIAGNNLAGMTMCHAIALGALLGGAAVIGDLIESRFKREAGVKDSGRLFPGIGGILDLLDSLLFNAPLMYVYMRYVMNL